MKSCAWIVANPGLTVRARLYVLSQSYYLTFLGQFVPLQLQDRAKENINLSGSELFFRNPARYLAELIFRCIAVQYNVIHKHSFQ